MTQVSILGIVLAITSALCWGGGAIFARLGLQNIKATTGTLISVVSSLLVVAVLALLLNFDEVRRLSLTALWWFGVTGVLSYTLGRRFDYSAIKYIGATRATALVASAPLFAMFLAVALIGERVNSLIVSGTLIIVAGVYLVVTSK